MPKVKDVYICGQCDEVVFNRTMCDRCLSLQLWPLKEWLGELPENRARLVSSQQKSQVTQRAVKTLSRLLEAEETALVYALWPILTGQHTAFCACIKCRDAGKRRVM